MKRILTFVPVLGLLLILAAGCSQDGLPTGSSDTATDDFSQIDLNQEFGGLSATDEDEAFADPELMAMLAAESQERIDDPLASDPEFVRMENQGRMHFAGPDSLRPRFTYLRLRWGMLEGLRDTLDDNPRCGVIDWTGSLHLDRGMLVVRRVIAFERPLDHVIFPRLDRQSLALVSHTGCGFDGVVLQIMEPPLMADRDPAADREPNRLHINLGPYTGVFDVSELAAIDRISAVEGTDASFQITGFAMRDIEICPKGFLSGRYRRLSADRPDTASTESGRRLGEYVGVWRTLDGRMGGFMRGGYGLNATGERVFVGKYVGLRGQFRGLIRGTWDSGAQDGDLAHFQARWHGASGVAQGVLGGSGRPVDESGGGFFVGRWATSCDPEAEDVVR